MIITRTPVRISLFGGGTDYPDYYNSKKGAVIGFTIDKYTYVSVNQLSDFFEYKIRVGYSKSELVNSVKDISHPSVRECLKFHNMTGNLDIHIFSDLPAKTGLGSSSSFTTGFLNALYGLKGVLVTKEKLVKDTLHVEQDMIGENVGSQDQVHASYGGFNLIEFNDKGFLVKPMVINKEKYLMLKESLMLFYTGQTRFANDVLSEQMEKTNKGDNDVYLDKMYKTVYDAIELISNSNNDHFLEKLGKMLDKSWKFKKNLSSKVSNSLIDDAYEKAMSAGAYGGKVTGAGGGGFLLILASPEKQKSVIKAMDNMPKVDFKFENYGSTIIYSQN